MLLHSLYKPSDWTIQTGRDKLETAPLTSNSDNLIAAAVRCASSGEKKTTPLSFSLFLGVNFNSTPDGNWRDTSLIDSCVRRSYCAHLEITSNSQIAFYCGVQTGWRFRGRRNEEATDLSDDNLEWNKMSRTFGNVRGDRSMRARGCHVYNMAGNLAGSTHARTLYLLHRRCLIFTVVFISRRTVTIIATDSKGVTLKRTPLFLANVTKYIVRYLISKLTRSK